MTLSGSNVIAESLVQLGVTHMFGIVGIPVIEVAEACIAKGIKFISFRNEQAAAYAATAYGYLTGLPGVCLVVGGPGVLHAVAGVGNSTSNCFPFLLLAGASETHQIAQGAFQELDQVSFLSPHTKFAARPPSITAIPRLIEKAYRTAYFGRPGPTYIDLPADFIQGQVESIPRITPPGPAPRSAGDPLRISQAADLLKSARSPLLIVGKGAAYAKAEWVIRKFQSDTDIAFLPTPMGKGVVPDDSDLNLSAARSAALKSADVILLVGARLNWILHYGASPKFNPNVRIVQVDIAAEELGNNSASPSLGITGDINLVIGQLHRELGNWKSPSVADSINTIKARNAESAVKKESIDVLPLKYQPVYRVIRDTLARLTDPASIIYVSEGANTMDISRSSFPLNNPRTRLDAGTNATMGLGMGYAIAAKAVSPDNLVVAIEGDSAFGFSAIEVETAVRSNLPIIIYVMNNSGVYHGVDPTAYDNISQKPLPSTALQLETKYHILAESLGANGYLVKTLKELESATIDAYNSNRVSVINVIIESGKDKKLEFGWMASTKAKI